MSIIESGLEFEFEADISAVKFDDSRFYRRYFNRLPHSKGVDVILSSADKLVFMEVKNCTGHEHDNNWRLHPDNSKVHTSPTTVNVEDRESLDVEVSKKVTMTLACLLGAHTKKDTAESAKELDRFFKSASDAKISQLKKTFWIILLLEGNFHSQVRTKKMIMDRLRDSIGNKLKWLYCKVDVVDSDTYREDILKFRIVKER